MAKTPATIATMKPAWEPNPSITQPAAAEPNATPIPKPVKTDHEALARLLNGGLADTAFWLANSDAPEADLPKALQSLTALLNGLLLTKEPLK